MAPSTPAASVNVPSGRLTALIHCHTGQPRTVPPYDARHLRGQEAYSHRSSIRSSGLISCTHSCSVGRCLLMVLSERFTVTLPPLSKTQPDSHANYCYVSVQIYETVITFNCDSESVLSCSDLRYSYLFQAFEY